MPISDDQAQRVLRAFKDAREDIGEYDGCTCQRCGGKYRVDIMVPDDLWEEIKPSGKSEGAGLLCGPCIMRRIEDRGNHDAFELTSVD